MDKSQTAVDHSILREEIHKYISSQMPNIEAHGGSVGIYEINSNTGFVRLKLAGSCATCLRGPRKAERLMFRLPKNIESIEDAVVEFVD